MPSIVDDEALARRGECGAETAELACITSAGKERVERGEGVHRCEHLVAPGAQRVGELEQDALDLLALLGLQLANAVAEFDRRRRLDEERRPCRRSAVHD